VHVLAEIKRKIQATEVPKELDDGSAFNCLTNILRVRAEVDSGS